MNYIKSNDLIILTFRTRLYNQEKPIKYATSSTKTLSLKNHNQPLYKYDVLSYA